MEEQLKLRYMDTFFNTCDMCKSKTHIDPHLPIHRGI